MHNSYAGVDPSHLLREYAVHYLVLSDPSVFFRKGDSKQPDFSEHGKQLLGKGLGGFRFFDQRLYLVLGEIHYHFPEHALFVCEFEINRQFGVLPVPILTYRESFSGRQYSRFRALWQRNFAITLKT